jgi:DNA-binding CsgD family transcriptional regulator
VRIATGAQDAAKQIDAPEFQGGPTMEWHARDSEPNKETVATFSLDQRWLRVELATPDNRADSLGVFYLNDVCYVLIAGPEGEKPVSALTRREREIASQIARGRGTKQIAHDLGISPHTTVTYVNRIRAKLGVRNRPEMVAALLRG